MNEQELVNAASEELKAHGTVSLTIGAKSVEEVLKVLKDMGFEEQEPGHFVGRSPLDSSIICDAYVKVKGE